MKFQIINKEGNPLSMEELDKDAAEFFGVQYNEHQYAKPNPRSEDWCNVIGYIIVTYPRKGDLTWEGLISRISFISAFAAHSSDEYHRYIMGYKPHIELCYHWKTKGYTPVCL